MLGRLQRCFTDRSQSRCPSLSLHRASLLIPARLVPRSSFRNQLRLHHLVAAGIESRRRVFFVCKTARVVQPRRLELTPSHFPDLSSPAIGFPSCFSK